MQRNHLVLVVISIFMLLALTACDAAEGAFEPDALDAQTSQLAGNAGSIVSAQGDGDGEFVADDACPYEGIGYWKNHPELWDTATLTLGAQTYTAEQMRNILNTPPRGDVSYILAQQLIAAKLNRTDDQAVGEAISNADVWLAENPLDSNPTDEARHAGVLLAEYLDDYNNGMLDPEACGWLADDDDADEAEDGDADETEDDVNDDLDEVNDDADDVDDDDERADSCTGADPHPHAMTLAEDYGVSYGTIMNWFCQGYGFGEIELAYLLSEEVGLTAEEVFALRAGGMGWGNVRKELGAAPGLGNDKPGRGNDKDKNTPPGLEKKDGDMPPGQEGRDRGNDR